MCVEAQFTIYLSQLKNYKSVPYLIYPLLNYTQPIMILTYKLQILYNMVFSVYPVQHSVLYPLCEPLWTW